MSTAVFTESPELSSTAKSPLRGKQKGNNASPPVKYSQNLPKLLLFTHFVRDLVAKDGHGGGHASLGRGGEGSPDHQTVGEVMKAVSHNYHHSQQGNPLSWEHKGSLCCYSSSLDRDNGSVVPGQQLKSAWHSRVLC